MFQYCLCTKSDKITIESNSMIIIIKTSLTALAAPYPGTNCLNMKLVNQRWNFNCRKSQGSGLSHNASVSRLPRGTEMTHLGLASADIFIISVSPQSQGWMPWSPPRKSTPGSHWARCSYSSFNLQSGSHAHIFSSVMIGITTFDYHFQST